jgi:hypothetical protein
MDADELRQVKEAIDERLRQQGEKSAWEAFEQALVASGLMKEIKPPPTGIAGERRLVPIQGEPLSQTIIDERR